jgi:predicted thioesterase
MVRAVTIAPGLKGTATMTVARDHTAIAIGSGDVEVLSTPHLVGLVERACVQAIRERLEPADTSVGMQVQFEHVAPTPVGGTVRADAVLETVRGRRLAFKVSAHDEHGLVGAGRITRVIVDRERFLERATRATDAAPPAARS